MPFESDKQRKYLWANKPEVAKQFAEHHERGGEIGSYRKPKKTAKPAKSKKKRLFGRFLSPKPKGPLGYGDEALNYEDPIMLNELKRKMDGRIKLAEDMGIDVRHDYYDADHRRAKDWAKRPHAPSPGRWRAGTAYDKQGRAVHPGNVDLYEKYGQKHGQYIDVPRTPSLANAWILGEEFAHAAEAGRDRTAAERQVPGYEWSQGKFLEELRAKKAADEFVGGYLTPDVQGFADMTRDSYRKKTKASHGLPTDMMEEALINKGRRNEREYKQAAQMLGSDYYNIGGGVGFRNAPVQQPTYQQNTNYLNTPTLQRPVKQAAPIAAPAPKKIVEQRDGVGVGDAPGQGHGGVAGDGGGGGGGGGK